MRIKTSQLVPEAILTQDVMGKTRHPLMKRHTVLTEKHIEFLRHFLIEEVYVSRRLNNGKILDVDKINTQLSQGDLERNQAFLSAYQEAIESYRIMYGSWRNQMPLDMPGLREFMIPLLEWVADDTFSLRYLHRSITAENYHYAHQVAVSLFSAYLGKKMGYDKGEWLQIGLAGSLSNSGMVRLDQAILTKPSRLTSEEMIQVKRHPVYSYRFIEDIRIITKGVKLGVLQHHERLDGSGYPLGLPKSKIHPFARIIAVSETFIAMTSDRYYRNKQSPQDVLCELRNQHTSTLDPEAIEILVQNY